MTENSDPKLSEVARHIVMPSGIVTSMFPKVNKRAKACGIRYDRCYSDTMLSNPSRTSESVPRAVNLGLLRLAHALQGREWSKAVAYCAQLLAREELPEVRAVLDRLQAAGHDGMRFDG